MLDINLENFIFINRDVTNTKGFSDGRGIFVDFCAAWCPPYMSLIPKFWDASTFISRQITFGTDAYEKYFKLYWVYNNDEVEAFNKAVSEGKEEQAIKPNDMSITEVKLMQESVVKHIFQAEVNQRMKFINSLYCNKEVYLRELISNASDALDKVRLINLTDKSQTIEELSIRIKADKENHVQHITDIGIGMMKQDLVSNLGTIAKSGTADFLLKLQDASSTVADRVVVTTKHSDDKQYIWKSDANSFSISEDPRGDTLKWGTQVSLYLKKNLMTLWSKTLLKSLSKNIASSSIVILTYGGALPQLLGSQ